MRFLVLGGGVGLSRELLHRGHRVAVVVGRHGAPDGRWEELDFVAAACGEVSDESLVLEVGPGAAAAPVLGRAVAFLRGCDGVVVGVVGRRTGRSAGPGVPAPWSAQGPPPELLAVALNDDAVRGAPVVAVSMVYGRPGRFDPPGSEAAALEAAATAIGASLGHECVLLGPGSDEGRHAVVLESLAAGVAAPAEDESPDLQPVSLSFPGSFTTRDGVAVEVSGPHTSLAADWAHASGDPNSWPLAVPADADTQAWLARVVAPIDRLLVPLARTLTLADRLEPSAPATRPRALTAEDVAPLMPSPPGWICRVPVDDPCDSLAVLAFWSPNHDLKPHHHAVTLRRWLRRYGAVPVATDGAVLNLYVARPPETLPDALDLAREHLAYCSEAMVLEQHDLSWDEIVDLDSAIAAYAPKLIGLRHWRFWWD